MAQNSGPFHLFRPGPPLAEFVDSFWIYEGYAPPHCRERLLPTGTTELLFTANANGRVTSGVAGARSECLTLDTSTPFSVVAVHFRPGGGFPFFGVPSSELHNRSVTLDLVWGWILRQPKRPAVGGEHRQEPVPDPRRGAAVEGAARLRSPPSCALCARCLRSIEWCARRRRCCTANRHLVATPLGAVSQ
jgi:Domain of unknown function (DUF6597)